LASVEWRHEVTFPEGSFRWGRLETDFVAEWPGVLALRARVDGSVEEVWTRHGIPTAWVDKLKGGAAAAFVRAVRGGLSWHAAAVTVGTDAFLILGDSGAGKSTVAYNLCHHHGATLLADDVAALNATPQGIVVEPTERVLWLADGAGAETPKAPRTASTATETAPLVMCVFLGFDEVSDIRSRPLTGVKAFERLLASALRFIPSPEQWCRELDAISRVCQQAVLVEVDRSRTTSAVATAEFVTKLKHRNEYDQGRLAKTSLGSEVH
jgi:hypothetical protein